MALSSDDITRAATLYAEGLTMRAIADQLGVAESTVSTRLRKAGVPTTPRGPARHPASTEEIVRLYDSGLTMAEVADQVGISGPGAWTRYRQARPPAPPKLGRWQQLLLDALTDQAAIAVQTALSRALGRPPTRAEATAARRAAHRLADDRLARTTRLAGISPDNGAQLVLIRPNAKLSDERLRQVVTAGPGPALPNHRRDVERLRSKLRTVGRGARRVHVDMLSDAVATELDTELQMAIAELESLRRRTHPRSTGATPGTYPRETEDHSAGLGLPAC